MNKYIEQQFAALRYEKNIFVVEETTSAGGCGSFNAASSCPASACLYDSAEGTLYVEFCPACHIVSMQHQQT